MPVTDDLFWDDDPGPHYERGGETPPFTVTLDAAAESMRRLADEMFRIRRTTEDSMPTVNIIRDEAVNFTLGEEPTYRVNSGGAHTSNLQYNPRFEGTSTFNITSPGDPFGTWLRVTS